MNQRVPLLSVLSLLWVSTAQAQLSAAEAPERPSAQALKVGIRFFDQPDLALSYERQFAPHWSVVGSLGYFPQHYTSYGIWYNTPAGQSQPTTTQGLSRHYNVDAQFRYYFGRQNVRPALTGWYAGLVVHGAIVRTREDHEATPTVAPYTTYDTKARLQPQLHLGRQWVLGQYLLLDTFVGIEIFRRATTTRSSTTYYEPRNKGLGVQLGLRL